GIGQCQGFEFVPRQFVAGQRGVLHGRGRGGRVGGGLRGGIDGSGGRGDYRSEGEQQRRRQTARRTEPLPAGPVRHDTPETLRSMIRAPAGFRRAGKEKGPARGPFPVVQLDTAYLILASLYATCLRTTGSYLRNSILFGVVFLFLSVV